MRFQKNPKQKNSYPGMLASMERKRNRDSLSNPRRIKTTPNFKGGFTQYQRKNPNQ